MLPRSMRSRIDPQVTGRRVRDQEQNKRKPGESGGASWVFGRLPSVNAVNRDWIVKIAHVALFSMLPQTGGREGR